MAAVTFDVLGAAEPFMKRYYAQSVYSTAYEDRTLLAWIPKKTGVTGGSPFGNAKGGYQVPLMLDDIVGESSDFEQAVDARDGYSGIVWDMNRARRYGTHEIDGEAIDAMDSVGAFMEAGQPLIDSAINQISNSLEYMLYHDGSGHRGIVGSKSSNTLTLTAGSSYLARTLSLKRTLVSSSTASGGSLDGESTGTKITGIVLDNGSGLAEITVADATNILVGHYLFPAGDYTATGENLRCFDGFASWGPDPTGITTGDSFKGVDRSVWKEKLLMLHRTIPLQTTPGDGSFVRAIREAAAVLGANGAKADALFVNDVRWAQIESDLASQSRYEMMMKGAYPGYTGFDSIVINAGGKKINVIADPWCPPNSGYLLKRNTWELFSTRTLPGPVSRDGNLYHRLERKDAVEFRLGGYGNLACRAPGHNMVLNFATS